MPLEKNIRNAVYEYCNNHLPDQTWYENEFEFIEDADLRKRLVEEFRGIRFAYKLYEGIEAENENIVFEIVASDLLICHNLRSSVALCAIYLLC